MPTELKFYYITATSFLGTQESSFMMWQRHYPPDKYTTLLNITVEIIQQLFFLEKKSFFNS